MQTVNSFMVDHLSLTPGIYMSEVNGCYTYDIRFCSPKDAVKEHFSPEVGHTIEHFLADYFRSDECSFSDCVYYVGPMGCATGFYLVLSEMISSDLVKSETEKAFNRILSASKIPGRSKISCGNPDLMSLPDTKLYLSYTVLPNWNKEGNFGWEYPLLGDLEYLEL